MPFAISAWPSGDCGLLFCMFILNRFLNITWLAGAALIPLGQAAENKADDTFWNSVFEANRVLDVKISLSREAWEAMQPRREEQRREGGPRVHFGNEFSYVKADIVIDGRPLPDTGMRFKGNSSYRFAERGLKRM